MLRLKRVGRGKGRKGLSPIFTAIMIFVGVAILAFVVSIIFGTLHQTVDEINTNPENKTYVSPEFQERINQAENFAGLSIFLGSVAGLFMVIMVLWVLVRRMMQSE